MKIIKQGIKPDDWTYIGECDVCGTIAEATRSELDAGNSEPEEGEEIDSCTCPVCEDENMLFKFKSKGEKPQSLADYDRLNPTSCSICRDPNCNNPGGKH